MMEKTLILKHISGMLCLLISYSKFTRTEIKFVLTGVVMPDILKREVTILAQNIYNQSAKTDNL